jgi:hypothetical protein
MLTADGVLIDRPVLTGLGAATLVVAVVLTAIRWRNYQRRYRTEIQAGGDESGGIPAP